jgi:hypothetical protein
MARDKVAFISYARKDGEDLKPFLRPASETTRLLTTRLLPVSVEVAEKDNRITIAELTPDESIALLTLKSSSSRR